MPSATSEWGSGTKFWMDGRQAGGGPLGRCAPTSFHFQLTQFPFCWWAKMASLWSGAWVQLEVCVYQVRFALLLLQHVVGGPLYLTFLC